MSSPFLKSVEVDFKKPKQNIKVWRAWHVVCSQLLFRAKGRVVFRMVQMLVSLTWITWKGNGWFVLSWEDLCSRHCWFVQGDLDRVGTTSNQGLGGSYKTYQRSCSPHQGNCRQELTSNASSKEPTGLPYGEKKINVWQLPHPKSTNDRFQLNQLSKEFFPHISSLSSKSSPEGTKYR